MSDRLEPSLSCEKITEDYDPINKDVKIIQYEEVLIETEEDVKSQSTPSVKDDGHDDLEGH